MPEVREDKQASASPVCHLQLLSNPPSTAAVGLICWSSASGQSSVETGQLITSKNMSKGPVAWLLPECSQWSLTLCRPSSGGFPAPSLDLGKQRHWEQELRLSALLNVFGLWLEPDRSRGQ